MDAETIRLVGDEQEFNNILKDLSTHLTEDVAEYKPMLEKLSSTDFNIRSEAARDFLRAVRKELTAEQNWQIDVGEQLGLLLGELLRQKLSYVKTGVAYDANILRMHLQRISDIVAAAPEGASAESKRKFQKVAAFSEIQDLNTDRRFSELIETIMPLFDEFDDH